MYTPLELVKRLVAVRSDTGSALERDMALAIYDIIAQDGYFKANPKLCGLYEFGDHLGRRAVWALKRGTSGRTVIFTGHFDAVEIDCYGRFREFALDPDALAGAMLNDGGVEESVKADVRSGRYMLGRGCADMKGGLAVALYVLLTREPGEANILFLGVPDEENMSAGARGAIALYEKLRDEYSLDYRLAVMCEPDFRADVENEPLTLGRGCAGKLLPVVVAHGRISHASESMAGMSAALMIAELTGRLEYNTEYICSDLGVSTHPPAALYMRDEKACYDVSLPAYAAACYSVSLLSSLSPIDVMERLRRECAQSLAAVKARYEAAYARMDKNGCMGGIPHIEYEPVVLSFAQLKAAAKSRVEDFDSADARITEDIAARVREGSLTLPGASIAHIRALIDLSGIDQPLMVAAVAPPYYPPYNLGYLPGAPDTASLAGYIGRAAGVEIGFTEYVRSMMDLSYFNCLDPDAELSFMEDMALDKGIYSIDFAALARLMIPIVLLGPGSRNIHSMYERAYLPDLEKNLPAAYSAMIDWVGEGLA